MAKPQVGVQEITDAAGVPKSSFYNHFDSKKTVGSEISNATVRTRARPALITVI